MLTGAKGPPWAKVALIRDHLAIKKVLLGQSVGRPGLLHEPHLQPLSNERRETVYDADMTLG